MKTRITVPHYAEVEHKSIHPEFAGSDNEHRATLRIPFKGIRGNKTLCIIGQNPSAASKQIADKTIHYLEKLVHLRFPEYGELLILNLYSRVDTAKDKLGNPLDARCASLFELAISKHSDFLVVYGKLKNQRAYKFLERARIIYPLLKGKNVMKLDIGTPYAPHPGNSKILYSNFNVGMVAYDFSDL